jgi:hypothetical protein
VYTSLAVFLERYRREYTEVFLKELPKLLILEVIILVFEDFEVDIVISFLCSDILITQVNAFWPSASSCLDLLKITYPF